jgi:ADP-ribose pyrophosphatase YjhB (NUDIX family)
VQAYPVSVKGVVTREGRILLLRNEREEWELPGGRLEIGETPQQCVVREIAEETGWAVTAGPILDAWLYHITQEARPVLIVTYGCDLDPGQDDLDPVLSSEHQRIGLFTPEEITCPRATRTRSQPGSRSSRPPARAAADSGGTVPAVCPGCGNAVTWRGWYYGGLPGCARFSGYCCSIVPARGVPIPAAGTRCGSPPGPG